MLLGKERLPRARLCKRARGEGERDGERNERRELHLGRSTAGEELIELSVRSEPGGATSAANNAERPEVAGVVRAQREHDLLPSVAFSHSTCVHTKLLQLLSATSISEVTNSGQLLRAVSWVLPNVRNVAAPLAVKLGLDLDPPALDEKV